MTFSRYALHDYRFVQKFRANWQALMDISILVVALARVHMHKAANSVDGLACKPATCSYSYECNVLGFGTIARVQYTPYDSA